MECTHCPLRATCKAPCAAVKELLPKPWRGEWPQLRRLGRREFLQNLVAQRRAVEIMLDHRDRLTGRLREIFDLTHNDALSQLEISLRLGIQRRVVSTYLKRAYRILAKLVRGLKPRQRTGKRGRVRPIM